MQAIHRLERALYEYFVGGIKTNISLFRRILKDPDFRAGNIDTGFLERLLATKATETQSASRADRDHRRGHLRHHGPEGDLPRRQWTARSGERQGAAAPAAEQLAPRARDEALRKAMRRAMTYDVIVDGKTHRLELTKGEKTWHCKVDGHAIEVDAALTARDVMSVLVGGDAFEIKRERSLQGEMHLVIGSARYAIDVQDPRSLRTRRAAGESEAGPQKITAPMPGKIVRISVAVGDEVKAGQGVIVMEAMKMQNEMKSPKDGKVQKILTSPKAQP